MRLRKIGEGTLLVPRSITIQDMQGEDLDKDRPHTVVELKERFMNTATQVVDPGEYEVVIGVPEDGEGPSIFGKWDRGLVTVEKGPFKVVCLADTTMGAPIGCFEDWGCTLIQK